MNLFLIGWNLADAERDRAVDALAAMHEAFPLLDATTLDSWRGRRGFAAWMHHPNAAVAPRRYVHATDEALTIYDGTIVDPTGRIAAHDARALAGDWDAPSTRLEGHYAAARLDDRDDTLELVNDPAGIFPLYLHRRGDRWWIANRVRLLAAAAGLGTLDLEGMATFVGMHWPGGDRTLVEGVSKLPAAQRWRWRGDAPPERASYWPLADLARGPRRSFGPPQAAALADAMRAPLRSLGETFGTLQSPITAGRDTRMLTALVMTSGAPADYFTLGAPDDGDVVVATALARHLGLPHRRVEVPAADLAADGEEVARRIVRRNDGLVTLMHARSALDLPERVERLPVLLYGAGGERTRGKLLAPAFVLRPASDAAEAAVLQAFDRGGPLLRPEARELVVGHIVRTCRALHELGFAPEDVPDAFEQSEHSRRWAAAQAFQRADHRDVFVPFFTRAYLRAAFEVRPADRLLERIPHELLLHLSPALRSLPTGTPWPPSTLTAYRVVKAWRTNWARAQRLQRRLRRAAPARGARQRERIAALRALLPHWRERFLDHPHAAAWQVIDRERFERLTAPGASEAEQASQFVGLYQAGTVLTFEEDLRAWTARWTSDPRGT